MKNLKKTVSAILAATVIFSTAAMSVYADKLKFEDGILYRYNDGSERVGEYSGWVKKDGVSMRYADGKPYTGWLKNKDGTYKYCLDGFLVKGEIPIKNKVYAFDENGVMTGSKKALLSVNWDGSEIYEPLTFYVTPLAYGEYGYSNPEKLERWENGEWVDCLGAENYVVSDEENLISFEDCVQEVHIFEFSPKAYIGNHITSGTYRLTLTGVNENPDADAEDKIFKIYCVFTLPNFMNCIE